ncbi:hypothetical protein [Parablautia muri]|uniref:Uncharacterized protein n=1 Tax=Parablautia muri TaxID=2320879 RepID=A0A9X5BEK6_9FIRM|nr:hypothetical protein [Parablautia muri]NBJ92300.1 hypothetical protein [Parablautia muri]
MKILKWGARQINKMSIAAIISSMLLGCTMQEPEDLEQYENKEQEPAGVQNEVEVETGSTAYGVPAGSLMLTPIDLDINEQEWENNRVVVIGSMMLILPAGWEMEQRVSKEGVTQCVIMDMHTKYEGKSSSTSEEQIKGHSSMYEHEILITSYEIKQMPELTLQLAVQLKEHFPDSVLYGVKGSEKTSDIKGCWFYGENSRIRQREYFLFSENEAGSKELFYVQEGDSTVTAYDNDVESFWKMLDEEMVWTDNETYIAERYKNNFTGMEYYFPFNMDDGKASSHSLLMTVQSDSNEMSVYRIDDYENPVSVQEAAFYPNQLKRADINGDGYEDFLCCGWFFDSNEPLDFEQTERFEGYLWDEESGAFVYVPGEQMLQQYPSFWETWRQEEARKGGSLIPKELTDYISGYLLEDKDQLKEAMLALVEDREMNMEEIVELADDNIDIKNDVLEIATTYQGDGIWLEADVDNDGIKDIFLCKYLGGSLGAVYYSLYAGKEDGSYELTDCQSELKEEFAFINWQGKNYLVKTTWDFTKKEVDGISLECYEKGKYQGGVWLAITTKEGANARDIRTVCEDEGQYESLKNTLEELAARYQGGDKVPCGSAEEEKADGDYTRSCDIDNDGEVEEYNVSLWQTTNYYTVDHLSFSAKEEDLTQQIYDMTGSDENGVIPFCLWVDKTEYGNITYILYEDGLYDFHICGYFISGKESRKVIRTDCHLETEVILREIT